MQSAFQFFPEVFSGIEVRALFNHDSIVFFNSAFFNILPFVYWDAYLRSRLYFFGITGKEIHITDVMLDLMFNDVLQNMCECHVCMFCTPGGTIVQHVSTVCLEV